MRTRQIAFQLNSISSHLHFATSFVVCKTISNNIKAGNDKRVGSVVRAEVVDSRAKRGWMLDPRTLLWADTCRSFTSYYGVVLDAC